MSVQDTYSENMSAARVGQIVNNEPHSTMSRTVEDNDGIEFGLAVAQGTKDKGVTATLTGVTKIVGITVRERSVNPETPNKRGKGESTRLMRKGVLWLKVTDAGGVSADDDVWLDRSTGGFSNADPGSSKGLKLSGCKWETSAANGALAQMRVNLDVPAVAGA